MKSLRRHHQQRMKDRFNRKEKIHPYWTNGKDIDIKRIGVYSQTKKLCSCWMCKNQKDVRLKKTNLNKIINELEE